MARVNSQEMVTRLRRRVQQAIDSGSGSIKARNRAFQQYFLQPTGTEEEGHPTIQAADVNSMITAVLSQISISFSADTVVEFEADNGEDEARAQAESRAINKILVEDNAGFREIVAGCQNALLYRNGYVKCYWDIETDHFRQKHENVEKDEVPIVTESELGKQKKLISYDPDTKTARVEVKQTNKRLRLKAVANERFFVDPDHDEVSLDDCSLCGEIHYKTRDQLSRMGVKWDLVKQLPAVTKDSGPEWTNTRRGQVRGSVDPLTFQMDLCRVFEVYARYADDDDDDRAYLYRCWVGDGGSDEYLIEPEISARVPYAPGSAFPIANQHEGESLAEKLSSIQDGKTEMLRQWFSNVRNVSWGRFGVVSGKADAADLVRPKPGGYVRMRDPDAITPIPILDAGPSIAAAMEYLDKQRSERGGASLDQIGAEMQVANDTAHGTERVYAAKEILVSYMVRNLAESMLRHVYLLAHAELRAGGGGPISLKVAEQWVQEDPGTWRERKWCNVAVAPSFGERMQMSNALSMSLQWDFMLMQGGMMGQLVTPAGLYKKILDWLKMNLIDSPEGYYIDPTSEQAQQAAQGAAQAQQQQAAMAQQMEQFKLELEQYKVDQKTMVDMFKTVFEGQIEMQKNDIGGTVDLIKTRTEAEAIRRAGSGNGGTAANDGAGGNSNRGRSKAGKARDQAGGEAH